MENIFGNWLKCLRNGQKKVGNDVDPLGNGSNMRGNDLIIWQNMLKMWKMT